MKDMKVKIDINDPNLTHERCQYRTPTGRQCACRVRDFEASYCPKHAASQLNDYDDIAPALTENASKFLNAQGINYSLAALYKLLASGRISPRRASTLAYISSLLLRSLDAIDNDRHPNAGNAKNPAPQEGTIMAKATVNGKTVNLVATPSRPGSNLRSHQAKLRCRRPERNSPNRFSPTSSKTKVNSPLTS